jgi:hypothetical protein
MRKRKAKKNFSALKAVKANARERVGQPKPERVIDESAHEKGREPKHKQTLSDLLNIDE